MSGPSTCTLCPNPPRYTCPRCSLRTCSLICSKAHKIKYTCSGTRDPASYIPLKDYTQGKWSDDFRWLEDGRRKITGWGEGMRVAEVGFSPGSGQGGRGGSMGRGRGRGRGGGGGMGGRAGTMKPSLRERLQMQLLIKGVRVDFMPEGMGRRKLNMSGWTPRHRTLRVTVHLLIPVNLLDSKGLSTETKRINHPRVLFSTDEDKALPKLSSLLPEVLRTESLIFLLPFQGPSSGRPTDKPPHPTRMKRFFPPLSPDRSLAEVLAGTSFIEFPTIHVLRTSDWQTQLRKGEVTIVPLLQYRIQVDTPRMVQDRQRDSGWGAKRKLPPGEDVPVKEVERSKPGPVLAADRGLVALGEYESASEDEIEDAVEAEAEEGSEVILRGLMEGDGGEDVGGDEGGDDDGGEELDDVGEEDGDGDEDEGEEEGEGEEKGEEEGGEGEEEGEGEENGVGEEEEGSDGEAGLGDEEEHDGIDQDDDGDDGNSTDGLSILDLPLSAVQKAMIADLSVIV